MLPLHDRLGTRAAFLAWLDTLHETHRAKRNFIALLDEFRAGLRNV